MSLRRRTTSVAVAATLAVSGLTGLAFGARLGGGPNLVQAASHDDAPDDVSGPCDEAEHADDLRCAAGGAGDDGDDGDDDGRDQTSTTTPSTTVSTTVSTTPDDGAGGGEAGTRTLDAAGAGTVTYTVSGGTLTLDSATPAAGWTVEVEQSAGHEIDLDFRSGTRRVQVDIEFEDGQVRERVRFRDDADDSEIRIENGEVVRTEGPDIEDDHSGPGGGGDDHDDDDLDDDDLDDDDHSGSGGDDDDDDDSSGSGGGDDD